MAKEYTKVEVGSAAAFKDTINTNYDDIAKDIEAVEGKIDSKVIVSNVQPSATMQNKDGIWIDDFNSDVV